MSTSIPKGPLSSNKTAFLSRLRSFISTIPRPLRNVIENYLKFRTACLEYLLQRDNILSKIVLSWAYGISCFINI